MLGEISIFFSASSKLKHHTARHELHAICLQNVDQEEGTEDHSERKRLVLRIPAADG